MAPRVLLHSLLSLVKVCAPAAGPSHGGQASDQPDEAGRDVV